MKVIVEVKSTEGTVNEGVGTRSGKPYKMAQQKVAVLIPGADYPVVTAAECRVPLGVSPGTFGDPEWIKPGRYEASAEFKAGEFDRGIVMEVNFRAMRPLVAAPTARAA